MSLTISNKRKVTMKLRGLENNPIATFIDYCSLTGTVLSSNVVPEDDGALINATNGGTYDYWQPRASALTSVTFSLERAAAFDVNFVGIAAHNLGTIGGLTVSAQYSTDNTTWVSVGASVTPTDDTNIGLYFENVRARYFRVLIEGRGDTDLIYVGALHVSEVITFPTRVYQGYTPPLQATSITLNSNVTEGGNYVGASVVRRGRSDGVTLTLLPDTFIRGDDFQAFMTRFNEAKPFFWAWRPSKYEDLAYCWTSGSPIIPTNSGPKAYMSFDMSMRSYNDNA